MPLDNIIDFNKESAKPVIESDDIRIRRESFQKMVEENELQGFFGTSKPRPPTGIIFNYDTEEVKKRTILPVTDQRG